MPEQTRNVVAFEDLAEDEAFVFSGAKNGAVTPSAVAIRDNFPSDSVPRNEANSLYSIMTNTLDGLLHR